MDKVVVSRIWLVRPETPVIGIGALTYYLGTSLLHYLVVMCLGNTYHHRNKFGLTSTTYHTQPCNLEVEPTPPSSTPQHIIVISPETACYWGFARQTERSSSGLARQ